MPKAANSQALGSIRMKRLLLFAMLAALAGCAGQEPSSASYSLREVNPSSPVPEPVRVQEEREAMRTWVEFTTLLEPIWPDLAPELTLLKGGFQGVADSQDDKQFLQAEVAVCDPGRLDAADKVGARATTKAAEAKAQGLDKKPDSADGVKLLEVGGTAFVNLRPHCTQLQGAVESAQEEFATKPNPIDTVKRIV